MTLRRGLSVAAALFLASCQQPAEAGEAVVLAPAAVREAKEPANLRYAIFAGGCFWGAEGVFSHVKGVTSVVSGFHGGSGGNAEYEKVSGGDTGHAEAIRITYDARVVRYDQLLRILFSVVADPTTLNRQGPDEGTQYRSAIVPLSEEQRLVASAYLAQLGASGLWKRPIVTKIEAHKKFYPAEAYHQDFMLRNPRHPYILAWDVAKVRALRRLFPAQYRAGFVPG